jgi:hypothetical protein
VLSEEQKENLDKVYYAFLDDMRKKQIYLGLLEEAWIAQLLA